MNALRKLALSLAVLSLAACANMSPTQKKWATVGAGVLVAGAVAAYQADRGNDSAAQSGPVYRDCSVSVYECAPVK